MKQIDITTADVIEEIKEAIMILADFWEVDDYQQQKCLETAAKCMKVVIAGLTDETD